mmetsp:Transcript_93605/g.238360  ORF Transcript_93605/g.238360 Transcript_93605/m.238360 type:complete len:458 (+) Transcript_93605:3-1376(+)
MLQGGPRRSTLVKTASLIRTAHLFPSVLPRGSFSESKAGVAPDYSQVASWLAHPRRPGGERSIEDANYLAAAGTRPPDVEARPCDCFWLVDSCYTQDVCMAFAGDSLARRWNVPLGSCEGNDKAKQLCAKVREQMLMRTAAGASCFNRSCRVYAPEYRQASVLAYLHLGEAVRLAQDPQASRSRVMKPEEATQAFDLAYSDVRRAFLLFVDDPANADRPFILAGHSQGSGHLMRLLQEEVETHPARLRRFVHAYLTGWAVPMDLFSRTLHRIRPSTSAFDIGSVSSWRTAATNHPDLAFLRSSCYYSGSGWHSIRGAPLLANNPISWSTGYGGEVSEPSAYRGALWPLPSNMNPRDHEGGVFTSGVGLRFGFISAETKDVLGVQIPRLVEVNCGPMTARVGKTGLLRVPSVRQDSLFSLTERDWLLYHDLDCALFHNNLQENVAQRVQAWKQPRSRL